jgi:DNA repair protein RecO
MHHIYTTPAFVIHSTSHGEDGKFLLMFTEDFGMIGATAQGIRLPNSKLRYHLQDFSYSNISVVRGKEVWRVTGAHEISHTKNTYLHLKILKFLKRLLHGEEKNEKLFKIIKELYKTQIKEEDYDAVECVTVLRILNTLGYIRNTDRLNMFLENTFINDDIIKQINKDKITVIKVINSALKESQL